MRAASLDDVRAPECSAACWTAARSAKTSGSWRCA